MVIPYLWVVGGIIVGGALALGADASAIHDPDLTRAVGVVIVSNAAMAFAILLGIDRKR